MLISILIVPSNKKQFIKFDIVLIEFSLINFKDPTT
jgi:hypothetical protein